MSTKRIASYLRVRYVEYWICLNETNTDVRMHWRIQGGAPGTRAPPWGSKFFHFHAVFGKNLKNNSNFESWRTPLGKSWIRHWYVHSRIYSYIEEVVVC